MNHAPLTWAPRILLVLFALFLTVFSLDVFEHGKDAAELAVGLFLHNLPSLLLLATVAAAWRREWLGAVVCATMSLLYVAWAWGRFPLITYFIIAGPLFVCAVLYLAAWRTRQAKTS